jgi:hypothetical protein
MLNFAENIKLEDLGLNPALGQVGCCGVTGGVRAAAALWHDT